MELKKFVPINKNTLQGLLLGKNWASDPATFNDPFEILNRPDFNLNKGHIEKFKLSELKQKFELEKKITNLGIVCYSAAKLGEDSLLWAHYSNNHTGICIVFEIDQEKSTHIHKVKYQKELPLHNTACAPYEQLISITTTKAIEWNYEQEYRQLTESKNSYIDYPGNIIEVIFGCRTTKEDMEMIIEIFHKNGTNCKFSKMYIPISGFSLGKITFSKKGGKYKIPLFLDGTYKAGDDNYLKKRIELMDELTDFVPPEDAKKEV